MSLSSLRGTSSRRAAIAAKDGDREFMLAAVQQNGHALRYASTDLQADKELVLVAVQNAWAGTSVGIYRATGR